MKTIVVVIAAMMLMVGVAVAAPANESPNTQWKGPEVNKTVIMKKNTIIFYHKEDIRTWTSLFEQSRQINDKSSLKKFTFGLMDKGKARSINSGERIQIIKIIKPVEGLMIIKDSEGRKGWTYIDLKDQM